MDSSLHHTIVMVFRIAASLGGAGLLVAIAGLGAALVGKRQIDEHPDVISGGTFRPESFFAPALFPAPQLEPVCHRSQLGEEFCWMCAEPTSVVGVLGRARVRGATLDSLVCKGCFAQIEHHVVERPALSLMHGDLTDFEIPADAAKVLAFPTSASMMKQGSMVS